MLDRDPCPTRADWGKIFRATATAGFVASAALHLSTFTPFPPAYAAAIALVLFAGAFVLLAALIVRLRESGAPARGRGRCGWWSGGCCSRRSPRGRSARGWR